jgi:hypothetical protein
MEWIWNSRGMAGARTAVVVTRPTPAGHGALVRALSHLERLGYDIIRTDASGVRPGDAGPAVILFVSGEASVGAIGEVRRLRAAAPAAYLLVGLDRFTARSAKQVYAAGATIVAPTTALDAVVRNFVTGTGHVREPVRRYAVQPPTAGRSHPIGGAFVERFHDARTGRLDARKIAEAYGMSLSALARALGVTQSALSKRPTAAVAQAGLRELEFVWATLQDILGTDERVRAWLNAKRRHAGDRAPIELLFDGSPETLGNYVRSVVAGEPA